MRFSSKDFTRTAATNRPEIPDELVHRAVWDSALDKAFSTERHHAVAVVDVPSRAVSMTLGGLEPGQGTRRHRHSYETVILVLEGSGFSEIEDRHIPWTAGDAFYVPVWAWHRHVNTGSTPARYVAAENTPLLQSLGAAVREEADELPQGDGH
jgi:quercetin dioxygenase-like cupin family protein